jgi:hypothetical protein
MAMSRGSLSLRKQEEKSTPTLLWYEIQGSKCSIAADVVAVMQIVLSVQAHKQPQQPKNTHTNTNTKLFEINTTCVCKKLKQNSE